MTDIEQAGVVVRTFGALLIAGGVLIAWLRCKASGSTSGYPRVRNRRWYQ